MSEVMSREQAAFREGTPAEVFKVFLKLGLTSFGGPIAHLAYFRDEVVVRRKWLDEQRYADLVALCQFLPGPASSQVGFALGLMRGGWLGAAAAWTAFTLPSAAILVMFAMAASAFSSPIGLGLIHGLKLVAVAVVAQAVWGMAKSLTPDRTRAGIAIAAVFAVTFGGVFGQLAAIVFGALLGLILCRGGDPAHSHPLPVDVSRTAGVVCLSLFFVLLAILPTVAAYSTWHGVDMFDAFYRSGSLVFGGGHVVLPLLEAETVRTGWISADSFLAGYGVAQAVPGPLFTFAAYLGAAMNPAPNGVAGAAICLVAIFLPGILLLVGALPFWSWLNTKKLARAAMRGANASVVGILGAALYNPVWTGGVQSPVDFALVLSGFLLLTVWKIPPWAVVVLLGAAGAASTLA